MSKLYTVVSILCGCGKLTSLTLALEPTTTLNTDDEVVAQVERIELHVDAVGGLDGLPNTAGIAGEGVAVDRNGDGRLEWVAQIDAAGALPEVDLFPGSNLGAQLTVDVFGLTGSTLVALGSRDGLTFREGVATRATIPFDLLPAYRPPRVVAVLPPDGGETPCDQAVTTVTILFSEDIASASLRDAVQFFDNKSYRIPATVRGAGTVLRFSLGSLPAAAYSVHVTGEILDLDGDALQQPVASAFEVPPACL